MEEQLKELIPDFDELEGLAKRASEAKRKAAGLDHQIKGLEAKFVTEALSNRNYWTEGKRPTITYCKEVVKEIGNTDEDREELQRLRGMKAQQEELHQYLSLLIEIRRDKLALYRTESANQRKAFL